MNLISLLVWMIVADGVTTIVTQSKIFAGLRDALPKPAHGDRVTARTFFGALLQCPMCFGFWVGVFFALLGWSPVVVSSAVLPILVTKGLVLLLSGAGASSVTWSVHVLRHKLGANEL